MGGRKVSIGVIRIPRSLPDWSDLDTSKAGGGDLCSNLNRLVEVSGLDEKVAAELLLGLRKGAVGGRNFAVSYPDRDRRLCGLKSVVSKKAAGFLDLIGESEVIAMDFLGLGPWQLQRNRLVLVD